MPCTPPSRIARSPVRSDRYSDRRVVWNVNGAPRAGAEGREDPLVQGGPRGVGAKQQHHVRSGDDVEHLAERAVRLRESGGPGGIDGEGPRL
jgi:hypothetical protein